MVLLVGVPEMVRHGLTPSRDAWCRAGALWHWGATAMVGANPSQTAHTCWGRRVVLGYAQEDLGNAVRNILYYRNGGLRHGEHGRVIETWCDRGALAIWHVVSTPVTGVEAVQVPKAAADKRPSRVHDVAPAATGFRVGPGTLGVRTGRQHPRTAGPDVRAPSVEGARPASDVTLCQLDLLRRAGDNCRP